MKKKCKIWLRFWASNGLFINGPLGGPHWVVDSFAVIAAASAGALITFYITAVWGCGIFVLTDGVLICLVLLLTLYVRINFPILINYKYNNFYFIK